MATYIINVVLAFLLYISGPVLIRYVLLRKPIESKWVTVGILVPFFIVFQLNNYIQKEVAQRKIYQELNIPYNARPTGSVSPILFLSMVLSYNILRRREGTKKQWQADQQYCIASPSSPPETNSEKEETMATAPQSRQDIEAHPKTFFASSRKILLIAFSIGAFLAIVIIQLQHDSQPAPPSGLQTGAQETLAPQASQTATGWLNKAIVLKEKKDWLGLEDHASRWTKAEPKDAGAWNNLGAAYTMTEQTTKAIEAYQQAISIKPDHVEGWINLGLVYGNIEEYTKAIEAYQQAIRINPDIASVWLILGSVYSKSNQPAKAIEAHQQAIRINPGDADAWYNLGVAYKRSGQPGRVMEVYEHLKTINPDKAEKFFNENVMPQG